MEEVRRSMEDPNTPTKEELLKRAAEKPVRAFTTLDVLGFDENGAQIFSYKDSELRHTDGPVRVSILEGTDPGVAVYCLSQIIKKIKVEKGDLR